LTVHSRDMVGVARTAAEAFLGYPAAAQSLRIDRAEMWLNAAAKPARAEVIIEGAVTVFDGFATFNEPIRVQVGSRTLELLAQKNGVASTPVARLRVKNADEYGIVRGGVMEFELVLNGADWVREFVPRSDHPTSAQSAETAATSAPPSAEPTLNLTLEVARGRHVASRQIARRTQP
jgi:hypothetical protein